MTSPGPLAGLKVVELGTLIAGPEAIAALRACGVVA
jgi:crotonobetainyl-CoA:carnitine CoA-transferase CaiB-like acyl-CoA transferase